MLTSASWQALTRRRGSSGSSTGLSPPPYDFKRGRLLAYIARNRPFHGRTLPFPVASSTATGSHAWKWQRASGASQQSRGRSSMKATATEPRDYSPFRVVHSAQEGEDDGLDADFVAQLGDYETMHFFSIIVSSFYGLWRSGPSH